MNFGKLPGSESKPEETAKPNDAAAQIIEQVKNMDPSKILGQVQANKNKIRFPCCEDATDVVEISNGLQGAVTLELQPAAVEGLKMSVDKQTLNQGEVAKVTFTYSPARKQTQPPGLALVRVFPVGITFEIDISFAPPIPTPAK
jgi:hypothetical protein